MLVDLEVFYLGHLKNFYTIQYNTIQYNIGRYGKLYQPTALRDAAVHGMH